jgi:oxygen-dependent protoporphyrinogen oxidase
VAGNFLDGVGVPACVSAGGRAADVVVAATGT